MKRVVEIGRWKIGNGRALAFIAGPCVIESRRGCLGLARRLAVLAEDLKVPFVFKASYDKANRTSAGSFRGPGLRKGLDILAEVRESVGVPVLTDIHAVEEVSAVADPV